MNTQSVDVNSYRRREFEALGRTFNIGDREFEAYDRTINITGRLCAITHCKCAFYLPMLVVAVSRHTLRDPNAAKKTEIFGRCLLLQ